MLRIGICGQFWSFGHSKSDLHQVFFIFKTIRPESNFLKGAEVQVP